MVQKYLLLLIFVQQIFCTLGIDPRTKGGKCDYEDGAYAVAVFLNTSSNENDLVCGGCLISLEWVLTAGQCIPYPYIIKDREIHLRTGFGNDEFIQKRLVNKGVAHPKFNKRERYKELRYDIGLLLADKPFEKTAQVRPAKLPSPGFASKCKAATVLEIGEMISLKSFPFAARIVKPNEPLRCVQLPIFSRDACSQITKKRSYVIDESLICTKDKTDDSCEYEPGTPLVCEGVVIGAYVAAAGCDDKKTENIHTKVEYFLDFLAEHTQPGKGTGRHSPEWLGYYSGSNTIVLSRILLIVLLLQYIVFNRFGY